jgi:hypothetical protein
MSEQKIEIKYLIFIQNNYILYLILQILLKIDAFNLMLIAQ